MKIKTTITDSDIDGLYDLLIFATIVIFVETVIGIALGII
jgi:hypothetical protein